MPMTTSFFIRLILIEMFVKSMITFFFIKSTARPYLISFTKNPVLADSMYLSSMDQFLGKFLTYTILISLVSLIASGIFMFMAFRYNNTGFMKVFLYIYVALFSLSTFDSFTDIKNYSTGGKIFLFKEGNFFLNQSIIKNAKESSDYPLINVLMEGSTIPDEDLLAILNKRPQEKVLNLSKENVVDVSTENLQSCSLESGEGSVVFEKKMNRCLFINNKKLKGESQVLIRDNDQEKRIVIYSL